MLDADSKHDESKFAHASPNLSHTTGGLTPHHMPPAAATPESTTAVSVAKLVKATTEFQARWETFTRAADLQITALEASLTERHARLALMDLKFRLSDTLFETIRTPMRKATLLYIARCILPRKLTCTTDESLANLFRIVHGTPPVCLAESQYLMSIFSTHELKVLRRLLPCTREHDERLEDDPDRLRQFWLLKDAAHRELAALDCHSPIRPTPADFLGILMVAMRTKLAATIQARTPMSMEGRLPSPAHRAESDLRGLR